jgi:hypothetical protein
MGAIQLYIWSIMIVIVEQIVVNLVAKISPKITLD